MKSKETKKQSKKTKETKTGYFSQVTRELKKVSWPTKKEVLKYSLATFIFILIVVSFFLVLNLILSGIIRMVG